MRGEDSPTGRAKTCWRFFVCYDIVWFLCCHLSSYVLILEKWEKTNEETMCIFPPFGSPSTSYCFVRTSMEFIECGDVWSSNGRKPPLLITSRQMCLKHLFIPGFELVSWIIGSGFVYDSLLCICYMSMKARLVVMRVQPCIGVSMKAQFVVIRVQPCFDLGLLGTLGQVWVSLGTSQVHSIWFVWV